jgi:chloramphenicol-sensitive protein RarD
VTEERKGLLLGLGAYGLWGFMPLYIRLVDQAGPIEVLAHRVLWSVVVVALLITAVRKWSYVRAMLKQPRTIAGLALAAALLAVNWGAFIYAVNAERVVEVALGYFINPLVSVLLGVAVLRERLRPWQWVALGIGFAAVAVLTVDYGHLPYVALVLAFSFGTYGLVKKRLGVPAAEGMFVESAVLAVPMAAYLAVLSARGQSTFDDSVGIALLLAASGVVTAVPLMFFAGAANRLPLNVVGTLQYLAPILQLGVGVLIFHEPMPTARLVGFALVWLALMVFTADGMRNARRESARRQAARRAAAEHQGTSYASSGVPL